jgi:hypothetical protein
MQRLRGIDVFEGRKKRLREFVYETLDHDGCSVGGREYDSEVLGEVSKVRGVGGGKGEGRATECEKVREERLRLT